MIVDTNTGEVLNPRIIHTNSRIVSHQHSHQHFHQHTYKRSLHSKLGAVRHNSLSIFAILAIALIFMNFYSLFTTNKQFTLYSMLSYFSDSANFSEFDIQGGFDDMLETAQELGTYLSYRIPEDNIFAFLNPLLDLTLGLIDLLLNVILLISFLGDCVLQLLNFILSLFRFFFLS